MKKIFLLLLVVTTLTSCIVKSLQPFYLEKHVKFDKRLLGSWIDHKSGSWEIISFKSVWEEDFKEKNPSEEDVKVFNKYKESYFIKYLKSEKAATFVATPFFVDKHLFLNLSLYEYSGNNINSLAAQSLVKTHSAAFIDFSDSEDMALKFLSEDIIGALIKDGKLRLDHELTGIDEDLVLTARPEELYQFLKKFMKSNILDKWDDDDIYYLSKVKA